MGQLREQLLTRVRSLGGMQVAPEVSACLEVRQACLGALAGRRGTLSMIRSEAAKLPCCVLAAREDTLVRWLPVCFRSVATRLPPPPLPAQATNAYGRLSALLRGEAPAGLLPPTPQAYIVDRVQELAGRGGDQAEQG